MVALFFDEESQTLMAHLAGTFDHTRYCHGLKHRSSVAQYADTTPRRNGELIFQKKKGG